MYFVDREELQHKLDYIEQLTQSFSREEGYGLERVCHMLIESVVDVGNMIIDGFIMRDPGSYQDVIDILEMENVISSTEAAAISATLPLRQWMVRDYTAIDHQSLKQQFADHLSAYESFKPAVSSFIDKELGPVSAFGKGGRA
ncbi:DUF86 domain-containing protein [Macrococcus equipercicus]|uniref:DUF86 domain-containing protein n=1 Tax=Macrococcus equipercicus TaxID=69967 RepID=A0A9Q9F2H3_9STAP|nr:DUF86 domain-containing protein [Macrococcus equipercicus]KAA1042535.1 DUF86 domain-containing protein [Macrococcus equipercicus]UTH14396.1 DUF86 domain-containing protein [Macrococcus equipercicus]